MPLFVHLATASWISVPWRSLVTFSRHAPRAWPWQLGKNCGDAVRLVAREQFAAGSATQGLDELTRLSGLAGPGARKIHGGR
jgi:hypothetical protein